MKIGEIVDLMYPFAGKNIKLMGCAAIQPSKALKCVGWLEMSIWAHIFSCNAKRRPKPQS